MLSCYHDNIQFEDPAFGILKGERAKNMWRMLLKSSKDGIKLKFSDIQTEGNTGSAIWIAEYNIIRTGRRVVNHVKANFIFQYGLIINNRDKYSLYNSV